MSPTVFRLRGYRFYFFSLEEPRVHVHVYCADGEAKFWLTPRVAIAVNHGLSGTRVTELTKIIEDRKHEIIAAWKKHFKT